MRIWLAHFFPDDFSRRSRAFVIAVFLLHLLLALFFVAAIPRNGGPDESAHFAYVRQLIEEHSLPVLTDPQATRDARTGAIAQHPPLTYLSGIPFYLAGKPFGESAEAHALRLEAVIWGVGTLILFWLILRENFPDGRTLWLPALTFAALLPHFLLLSSVWNNDGLLIVLSTAFLLVFLRLVRDTSNARDWLWLGILWGLALVTKATALIYVVPVFWILALRLVRRENPAMQVAKQSGAFLVPGLLIGGWWFVRFYFMIGRIQPIPDLGYKNSGLLLKSPFDLFLNPDAPTLVGRFVAGALRSLWGQVDWSFSPPQRDAMGQSFSFWQSLWGPTLPGQYPTFFLTLALYRLAVVATVVAVLGLFAGFSRRKFDAPLKPLALFFVLLYGALFYYTLFKHPGFFEGGRYLLPVLSATATLWVSGLNFWLPANRQKWLAPALLGLFLLWDVGCAINLTQVLVPLYAPK